MPLYKTTPPPTSRMEMLWILASVRDALVLEFGCKGHMLYAKTFMARAGLEAEADRLASTHLEESDVIFGGADRLHAAAEEAASAEGLCAIFLMPSSVPMIIGIDLEAIASELRLRYPKLHIVAFDSGGFNAREGYGAEQALLTLAREFAECVSTNRHPSFNLIGAGPKPFGSQEDVSELMDQLEHRLGIQLQVALTSDCSTAQLSELGVAHVNIVADKSGIAAAQYLEKRFGMPFITWSPAMSFKELCAALEKVNRKPFLHAGT